MTLLSLALLGCVPPEAPGADSGMPGNVVVILSDDIGVERTGAYGDPGYPTYTPNIDALADEGVLFRNAYAAPTCSATRASLLTGRLPTRHGVGRWLVPPDADWDLALEETTLAEMLQYADPPYVSAALGKWHLVRHSREEAALHPMEQGFERHRGSLSNPREATVEENYPRSYTNWQKNTDGTLGWTTKYMTTDTVDEALAAAEELPEPWLLYVALNAAHEPWHVPPEALNTVGVAPADPDADLFDADVAAVDTEIGRLLAGLDPGIRDELTVVYLTDNGTPDQVIRPPYDPEREKGTVYEGGVRVPLIITGPHVAEPGSESEALVHVVDLFPTLAEIAHVDATAWVGVEGDSARAQLSLDGHSLLPLLEDPSLPEPRDTLFTEGFFPNGDDQWKWRKRTIRNHTHKLMVEETRRIEETRVEAFYDLDGGEVDEGPPLDLDLLSEAEIAELTTLRAALAEMDAELTFGR